LVVFPTSLTLLTREGETATKGSDEGHTTSVILVVASLVEPVATQGLVAAAYLQDYRLN
jgi:hypothetical protein